MAKIKVKLVSNAGNEVEFDFDHAENLLKINARRTRKTWKIAQPDKFKFVDGELRQNTSASSPKKSDGKSGNEGKASKSGKN